MANDYSARQPRRKYCQFCKENTEYIDYKDTQLLRKYMTDRGKTQAPSRHWRLHAASARHRERNQARPRDGSPALRRSRGFFPRRAQPRLGTLSL